jgi:hypothetical protein
MHGSVILPPSDIGLLTAKWTPDNVLTRQRQISPGDDIEGPDRADF